MNANKQDAGGLPELPEPGHYDDYEGEWYWTGSQMRAYGELCRATPADNAGGLVWYVCTSCMLMVQLPSDTPTLGRCQCSPKGWSLRRAKLPKGYELCRAAPAGGVLDGSLQYKLAQELDSAPAGSGEASRMDAVYNFLMGIADLDGVSFGELHPNKRGRFWWRHELAAAYALLRKLQQGAECFVREMRTSKGSEFFVVVRCNGRELTPHMYAERWKAEYDVASWQHLLSGAPEPDILAYGPASQGQEGGANG